MLPTWTHILAATLPDNPDVSDETPREGVAVRPHNVAGRAD